MAGMCRLAVSASIAVTLTTLLSLCLAAPADAPLPAQIDFNRDIRPILSDNCYACHGPDQNKRKADLRLDTQSGIFSALKKEKKTVVPGKPEQSELYQRISHADPQERMPPADFIRHLDARQVAMLKKWIEQGAPWQGHWAYIKPTRHALPDASLPGFVRNAVDRHVLAKLREVNLPPSPEADRPTLIRRLSFDLTGLPPTPAEVSDFLNDTRADAYERLVDRLLESPHFGERMAIYWLDLVRYADSIGYHSDNPMNVSPYRDYVIRSFNENKRFDEFTIEQLAGDLLPDATTQQKVASAYNRLLQTTEEGGAQPKEYVAKYAADRVRNASTVWLGATMGCAECHDHKFDPFTMRDFYNFEAFFADIQEVPVGRREPGMALPSPEQTARLAELDQSVVRAKRAFDDAAGKDLSSEQAKWESDLAIGREDSKLPPAIKKTLAHAPVARTPADVREVADYFRTIAPSLKDERDALASAEKARGDFQAVIPKVLVTTATTPRTVRVLPRGNWLDDSGPEVAPATPAFLGDGTPHSRRANRLDLAQWLVSRDNPLTARVFVNRIWKLYFGQGLSKVLDDLGAQGEWPTHPELLDWLACEFMESGWDVKHMVRVLVTSGTYRQASRPSPSGKEQDPYNRLYARQSRFRLDAEAVRDNALAIADMLHDERGGPSVFPYQPKGYWYALNFPTREWENSSGDGLYRRGLYTHWQRSFLHPSLLAFDAPSREEATCERNRSNIPQQALVLLNDPTYVEASRVFAQHIMQDGGTDTAARLAWAFERALARPPSRAETDILADLLSKHRAEYAQDAESAKKLLGVGDWPVPADLNTAELAAWTNVARVILNLHETITRS